MKKGFTLVELLAVIVILAVILVIAVPLVLKVVDNSRISAYLKNEQMVLKAVDLYVSRNTGSLPGEVGSTTEVSINYLVSNGMLTEITNPYNKNEDCTGYVTIMKLSDTEYDYTPHLRCGLNIHDSSDDGLVLHYKFEDFQEPTENIINNPFFKNNFSNWSQQYASGDNSIIRTVESSSTFGGSVVRINNSGSHSLYGPQIYQLINLEIDTIVTVSVRVRLINNVPSDFVIRWGEVFSGDSVLVYNLEPGVWKNIVFTTRVSGNKNMVIGPNINSDLGVFEIDAVQLEKKSYGTPIVENDRQGLIRDLSINENHVNMDLNTTPRWLYNEKRKSGIYEFDGINNSINLNNIIGSGEKTISLWVKPDINQPNFTRVVQRGNSDGYGFSLRITNNKFEFFLNEFHTSKNIVFQEEIYEKWYHIVGVYNNSDVKFYVNSVEAGQERIGTPVSSGNDIVIGCRVGSGNFDHFSGMIDDVRIYNRSLSETEIKLLYESRK